MKKLLILFALAASATTLASMNAAGSSPTVSRHGSSHIREDRACALLLKEMARSPDADTWRNRMRAWPCMQRAEAAPTITARSER